MQILDTLFFVTRNKKEIDRLHENHNNAVKDEYKCDVNDFSKWLYNEGHEEHNLDSSVDGYIEIPSYQTLSGHAVILDW